MISETEGFKTTWSIGDTLGIYPIGGNQVDFPISEGEGSTFAKFDGGSWALRDSYKYAAYYPFSHKNFTSPQTAVEVSYVGQFQREDGSTSHLGNYDFLAAPATQPNENGSVNLLLNHLGCFLRIQLAIPRASVLSKLTITSDNAFFTKKGTVDLTKSHPSITPSSKSQTISLLLDHIVASSEPITLYLMVAPVDLSNSNLTFTAIDASGNTYSSTLPGQRMNSSYAYNYDLCLDNIGTGGEISGGEWDVTQDMARKELESTLWDFVFVQGNYNYLAGKVIYNECFTDCYSGSPIFMPWGYEIVDTLHGNEILWRPNGRYYRFSSYRVDITNSVLQDLLQMHSFALDGISNCYLYEFVDPINKKLVPSFIYVKQFEDFLKRLSSVQITAEELAQIQFANRGIEVELEKAKKEYEDAVAKWGEALRNYENGLGDPLVLKEEWMKASYKAFGVENRFTELRMDNIRSSGGFYYDEVGNRVDLNSCLGALMNVNNAYHRYMDYLNANDYIAELYAQIAQLRDQFREEVNHFLKSVIEAEDAVKVAREKHKAAHELYEKWYQVN